MANYGFEILVIKSVFADKNFSGQADFTKLVLTTGLFLGIIRCYGFNYDIHLPNEETWRTISRSLKVPENCIGSFPLENGLTVIKVLNQKKAFKKWWKVRTVSLLELFPDNLDRQAEDVAFGEGAKSFVDRRRDLALAVFSVATAYSMRERKLFRDGDFSEFPNRWTMAWDEQVALQG